MAQDVKLKINGDASGLLAAVKTAMAQIEQEAKKLKLSPGAAGAAPGTPGSQTFQQALQTTRAKERERRDDQAALNIANSALAQKNRELDNLARKQKAIVSDKKAEVEYERQITQAQKERNQLRQTAAQLEKNLGGGAGGGAGGGGGRPGAPGGMLGGMGKGGITSLSGLGIALGLPVAGMVTAIAAATAAESSRVLFQQTANRARTVAASAFNTQGQGGQLLENAFAGGASQDIMFSVQRTQAAQIAQQTFQENLKSPFRFLKHKKEWFNQATGGIFGLDPEVAQEQRDEQAKIQAEQYEAIKQGPEGKVRTEVSNKYIRDWRRNLDFQRQMGQTEGGFRNFLGGVNSAGFGDEQGMGMASQIMGAGGSTRAATGNAALALQMGRQFDLTNAGQAIGAISGQIGGTGQSKDALIAIQAEGTRIGLNRSDMREENRKFVEMAANVINQSNVTSGAGVDQIMEMFSRAMTGATTVTGLEAGKSAYEAYQRQSNIQQGPSAVMRAAGMRGDKVLGKLSERDRAALSMMPESEITTDSNEIQVMAAKYGVSAGDIVKNYHGVIGRSLFVNPTTDTAVGKLRSAQKNFAISPAYLNNLEGEAAKEIRLEGAGAGMTEKQLTQYARMEAADDYQGMAKLQEDTKRQAESGKTVRPGDEMEKQAAQASRMANELFVSIQKDIEMTAAQTAVFTARINELVAAMRSGDAARITAAQNALGGTPIMAPSDQNHATTGGPPTTSIATHQ